MARWRGRQSQIGLQSRIHPDDHENREQEIVAKHRKDCECCPVGCPKKTLLLSIILAVESLVRMGHLSHQKKFQNYRPINDP